MKRIVSIVAIVLAVSISLFLFAGCGEKEAKEVRVEYSPGEFFTTNVQDSGRLLKSSIVLVVNAEGLEETLALDNTRIRDTIIFILRELGEEDIKAPGTQEVLRDRIVTALNERLEVDYFVEVRFNDFVMG